MRLEATRWSHYYWAQSSQMLEDRQLFPEDGLFWENYCFRTLLAYGCMPGQARELAPPLFHYMQEEYNPSDFVPPDVPGTLENLLEAGFRLAMLSNRSQTYDEELETLGLAGYFEFALAAGEVDVWKPDPWIFRYALNRLGTQPGETLYIGDNYYADVIGAQRAGLEPILVDPSGVFPEVECTVIHNISELCELLDQ
jgi:HAD superfamily hydrolase (TIGR01509 family)